MPLCWTVCPPLWPAVIVLVQEIEWNGCPCLNASILVTIHSISLGHWWWQVCSKKLLCELRQKELHFFCCKATKAEEYREHLGIYQFDSHLRRVAHTLKKSGLPGPFWAFFAPLQWADLNTEGSRSLWNTGAGFPQPPAVSCVECRGQNGNAF